MARTGTILLMAGAREAHDIAPKLLALGRTVIACLPEPERSFPPLPVPTRIGSFADVASFDTYVAEQGVCVVIDASHGFDAAICARTVASCEGMAIPYLRVLRPQWQQGPSDQWTTVQDVAQAQMLIKPGMRVFSTTGRGSLSHYKDFQGLDLFLRQTDARADTPPWPFVHFVPGRPPFSTDEEIATFQQLKIDQIICRNVGGLPSQSKILAARELGLPVTMIARPAPPVGEIVETVEQALAWEAGL